MSACHILHYDAACCQQEARAFKRACPEMPMSASDEHEQEAFGPDAIAVLAVALEDALHQLRLVDRNDPAATKVAKKIIELARRGEGGRPSGAQHAQNISELVAFYYTVFNALETQNPPSLRIIVLPHFRPRL